MNPWSEYGCGLRAALVTDRRPCDLIPSMEQSMDGSCTVGGVDAAASPSGIDIELGMLAAESDCPKSASAEEESGVKEKDENELLLRCDEEVDYDDDDAENSSSAMQDPAPAVDSEVIKGQEEEGDCEKGTNRQADMATRDDIQKKEHPLYALRRNPKRSQRFIDEEYTLDISTSAVAPSAITKKSSSIFNEKARACTECGKEFSSWKALFGHMRCHPEREWRGIQRPEHLSHYQQQDKLSKSSGGGGLRRNSNKEPKPPSLVLDLEELETTTTFMKVASDNESDTESIEAAYMNGCCSGSSKGKVTGKRSKRPRQTVVSVVSSRSCLQQELAVTATTPTEIKEERDMANCLVMLACAGRRPSNSLGSVQSQEDEEDEDSSTNDMNGNGGDSWSSDEEDEEEGEVTGLKKSRELDQDQQHHDQQPPVLTMMGSSSTGNGGLSTVVIDNSSLFCGGGNGGDELLDQEIETSGGSASGVRMAYECSTCKRIFKSHQALGGHRASHKKVKGCFARTNLGSDGMVQEGAEEEVMDEDFLRSEEQLPMEFHQLHYHHSLPVTSAMGAQIHHPGSEAGKDELGDTTFSVSSSRKLVKGHECSICHRVFTSGQALGGHKRCHWGGTERVVDSSTSSVTASKPGGLFGQLSGSFSMSRTGSVVKEEFLDLNLPAPMEDEDDEDGEEEDDKIKDSSRNKKKNSSKNDMEMVYKLPQLVPASALKRNAGAMSSFNAYLDIDKSHLHKDVRRKVMVEQQQQQQQQQHPDKTMSGDNEAELRCFRCDVCKCVFSSTESLNSHHNVEHTAGLVASTISGLTPISAS